MNILKNNMPITSGILAFENSHWSRGDQELVLRHTLALPFISAGPVLDIGGGDGLFSSLIKKKTGFDIRLVDISPIAVQKAREKGLDAEVLDISADLPFHDKSFGTVCALDVLEHVYDPLFLLCEMKRVGGSVVISVPNFHFILGRISMAFGYIPFQSKPRRGHIYWFNYPILLKIIRDAGMHIESISYGPIMRLGVLGRALASLWPNVFADSFVVLLKETGA